MLIHARERLTMKELMPIAEDPNSKVIMNFARKAAKSNATVLISGDTGVGKEVLAHYIHQHSTFCDGPFISINCAAIPDNMVEAILFGYEKGAFTSAVSSYVGKFEQANNGTLLLDEISEISIGLQAKLLRVLQEREIERLGGKKIINLNIRVIAATNRDLRQQIAAGMFRKDLYYRLNVIPIHCAALKDRRLDILPLAESFIRYHAASMNRCVPSLTEAAKQKLLSCEWPGNIRELDNVLQRTLTMLESDEIGVQDIVLNEDILELSNQSSGQHIFQFSSRLAENEAQIIMDVLKEVAGCRTKASEKLQMSSRTLRYKIAKLRAVGFDVP
jgi:two-component system response regulator FlrC